MKVTDSQWEFICPYIPEAEYKTGRRGPPQTDPRKVLNGILWIIKTGARWKDLPKEYPSYQTCHRWFQKWVKIGAMYSIVKALVEHLKKQGNIDLTETFIDATYVDAQKGGPAWGRLDAAMGPRSWRLQTVDLFLSPFMLRALHHMRLSSLSQQFGDVILMSYLSDLSETKLTILMNSMPNFPETMESSSLLPISAIEKTKLKMAALLEDTGDDGLSNDYFLGYLPIEESRYATKLKSKTISELYT